MSLWAYVFTVFKFFAVSAFDSSWLRDMKTEVGLPLNTNITHTLFKRAIHSHSCSKCASRCTASPSVRTRPASSPIIYCPPMNCCMNVSILHMSRLARLAAPPMLPMITRAGGPVIARTRSQARVHRCQHGDRECLMNSMQNCVIHKLRRPQLYAPIVFCLQVSVVWAHTHSDCTQNRPADSDSARDCVPSHVDPADILSCAFSARGRSLLNAAGMLCAHPCVVYANAGELTKALEPKLDFVPWIMIDGARDAEALRNLKRSVCKRIKTKVPKTCQ
jgi:hypothetical protein